MPLLKKEYKTVDEQIIYLREKKRIHVATEDRHWLEDMSYVSLINPFKDVFASGKDREGNHVYAHDTDFRDVVKVMQIDLAFSNVLYRDIREFERKFKRVVIDECCRKYIEKDIYCITYIDEIRTFLEKLEQGEEDLNNYLPCFCPNYFSTITRNGPQPFVDKDGKLKNLLTKIYSSGTGYDFERNPVKISNSLQRHYIRGGNIVPLWVIPCVLTLGEISMLFNMLDVDAQNNVYMAMVGETIIAHDGSYTYKKLTKFTGLLEIIRKIRNTINHYEPIFPVLTNEIRKPKELRSSAIIDALKTLNANCPILQTDLYRLETSIPLNLTVHKNNLVKIRILEFMIEYTNKQK